MSGYGPEAPPGKKDVDPALKFLGGCALVVGAVAAVVILAGAVVTWRLVRDETPGRAEETFFTGDETRAWCVDLKPDDAGVQAFLTRWEEANAKVRHRVLENTPLRALPFPRKRARLDEIAPLKIEIALWMAPRPGAPDEVAGWAARGTFSHGIVRMRLAVRMMRWLLSRNGGKSRSVEIEGVQVGEFHDPQASFALTSVGNRALVASDDGRMRAILGTAGRAAPAGDPVLLALRALARLPGEDGWATAREFGSSGARRGLTVPRAAASFDVQETDALAFRVAMSGEVPGGRDACAGVAASFLPGVPEEAITIDSGPARADATGAVVFTGHIDRLSERIAGWLARLKETREPEPPSAIPTPPSPATTEDPRSGTRAEPPHEESPTPAR